MMEEDLCYTDTFVLVRLRNNFNFNIVMELNGSKPKTFKDQ